MNTFKKICSLMLVVVLILAAVPNLTGITTKAYTSGNWTYYIDDYGYAEIAGYSATSSVGITIPTTIGNYSVKTISRYAFRDNDYITSVSIPDSITTIEDEAFRMCSSLSSVTIGSGVSYIGNLAFAGCTKLKTINVSASNPYFTTDSKTVLFNKAKTRLFFCIPLKSGAYTVPSTVKTIENSAFLQSNITSVVIPDSVTSIGVGAFKMCDYLTNVTLSKNIVEIPNEAFFSCDLTSVDIPDSVISIGNNAFEDCYFITSLSLPKNLYSIGYMAFSRCSRITDLFIPYGTEYIGDSAFTGNTSLTNVTIPDTVTNIGSSAFYNCSAITDVYYHGSQNKWNSISVSGSNTPLTSATIHYDCCEFTEWNINPAPTCTASGSQTRNCNTCGKIETEAISALGHSGDWIIDTEATCEKDGVKHRTCTVCGETQSEIISSQGHITKLVTILEPTCTAKGEQQYICTICNEKPYNAVYRINELGHTEVDGICTVCDAEVRAFESEHPYGNNIDETYTVTFERASKLCVKFFSGTILEKNSDYLYLYDENGKQLGRYTNYDLLLGLNVYVTGTTVKIRFKTNSYNSNNNTYYGYKAEVTPVYYKTGDLNGDDAYDAQDLTKFKTELLTGKNPKSGDLNENGILDIIDLIKLKKLMVTE